MIFSIEEYGAAIFSFLSNAISKLASDLAQSFATQYLQSLPDSERYAMWKRDGNVSRSPLAVLKTIRTDLVRDRLLRSQVSPKLKETWKKKSSILHDRLATI